jgi:GTP-binding protein
MPLFETILRPSPPPYDPEAPLQFLVTNLDYSDYVGLIAVGKIVNGALRQGQEVVLLKPGHPAGKAHLSPFTATTAWTGSPGEDRRRRYRRRGRGGGLHRRHPGRPRRPAALPAITVEEPTISMVFSVNTSPLAGKEGRYLTSRHIKERLDKEVLYNVSIRVEPAETRESFRVSARGELQLAVLIEMMRREGFELSLSKPKVITQPGGGQDAGAPGTGRGGHPRGVCGDRHRNDEQPAGAGS